MDYYGHKRGKNITRHWWNIFFFLVLLLPRGARATDCDTNCEDACLTSWRYPCGIGKWCDEEFVEPACKLRCDAEKVVACETGLNFCDFAKLSDLKQWYATKEELQLAADAQVIHSYNHCLDIVRGGGEIGGAADTAAWLGDIIWKLGLSTLPPGTGPLTQAYLSCICSEIDYGNSSPDNDSTVPDSPEGGVAAGVAKDQKRKAVLFLLNQYMTAGF